MKVTTLTLNKLEASINSGEEKISSDDILDLIHYSRSYLKMMATYRTFFSEHNLKSLCEVAEMICEIERRAPADRPNKPFINIDTIIKGTQRIFNCLRNNECMDLDVILNMHDEEFLIWPNFGRKSLNQLDQELLEAGHIRSKKAYRKAREMIV